MRIVNFSADVNSQIRNSQMAYKPKKADEQQTVLSEVTGESAVVQETSGETEKEQEAPKAKKKSGAKKKSTSTVLPDEGGISDEA